MLSALTLLDSEWNAPYHRDWQYAAVADEMRRRGVPVGDLQALFTRMCYNAMAGNSDDHPRNHAVIWLDGQWRLSPLYDVLPMLDEGPAKALAMAVGREGSQISRLNLLSHHAHFGLARDQAEHVLEEVASWVPALRDHYATFLAGADLDSACAAASSDRMLS